MVNAKSIYLWVPFNILISQLFKLKNKIQNTIHSTIVKTCVISYQIILILNSHFILVFSLSFFFHCIIFCFKLQMFAYNYCLSNTGMCLKPFYSKVKRIKMIHNKTLKSLFSYFTSLSFAYLYFFFF